MICERWFTDDGVGEMGKGRGMGVPRELAAMSLYAVDEKLLARWEEVLPCWKQSYPGVDVLLEIRKAHSWELCNPANRKKDRIRFLNKWLSRAQDNAVKAGKPIMKFVPQRAPQDPCGACKGTALVDVQAVNKWGETYMAKAQCGTCRGTGHACREA